MLSSGGVCRDLDDSVGDRGYRVAMTIIEHPTREDIAAHRDAILRSLGVTADELAQRAADGELVGEEWVAWAEIEELGYLLGE